MHIFSGVFERAYLSDLQTPVGLAPQLRIDFQPRMIDSIARSMSHNEELLYVFL